MKKKMKIIICMSRILWTFLSNIIWSRKEDLFGCFLFFVLTVVWYVSSDCSGLVYADLSHPLTAPRERREVTETRGTRQADFYQQKLQSTKYSHPHWPLLREDFKQNFKKFMIFYVENGRVQENFLFFNFSIGCPKKVIIGIEQW